MLDLSSLFRDVDVDIANADAFLQFEQSGANDVAVSADVDGAGRRLRFVQVVTLVDPTGVTTVQDAVASGAVAVWQQRARVVGAARRCALAMLRPLRYNPCVASTLTQGLTQRTV